MREHLDWILFGLFLVVGLPALTALAVWIMDRDDE